MYIVNDINHLLVLVRVFKVHELLPAESLSISRMKIQQYGAITRQQLISHQQIINLNIDDITLFENWCTGKGKHLSSADLSTIYIASKNPQQIVLLSEEDFLLPSVCDQCGVRYRQWEEIIREIADERMIEMYKLIKNAS